MKTIKIYYIGIDIEHDLQLTHQASNGEMPSLKDQQNQLLEKANEEHKQQVSNVTLTPPTVSSPAINSDKSEPKSKEQLDKEMADNKAKEDAILQELQDKKLADKKAADQKVKDWNDSKKTPFKKPIFHTKATSGQNIIGMTGSDNENQLTFTMKGLAANLIDHLVQCKQNSSSSIEIDTYQSAIEHIQTAVGIAYEKLIK